MFSKTIRFKKSLLSRPPLLVATALTAGFLLPAFLPPSSAQAGQLVDGRYFFDHAPRIVRAAASFPGVDVPSTYHFTLKVPENAGASLQAVRITPDNNQGRLKFDMSRTSAFRGTSFAGGPAVSLANVGGAIPDASDEVMVVFDPPLAPGETVTVSLETDHNPNAGGVYLFGVTAFPVGDNSPGLFLGYGRVNLYDSAR